MRNLWLIFLNFPNSSAKLGLHGKNLNGNWASVVSNNRSRANGIDLKFIEPTV